MTVMASVIPRLSPCAKKKFFVLKGWKRGGEDGGWEQGYIMAIHHEISGAICSHVMAGGA